MAKYGIFPSLPVLSWLRLDREKRTPELLEPGGDGSQAEHTEQECPRLLSSFLLRRKLPPE